MKLTKFGKGSIKCSKTSIVCIVSYAWLTVIKILILDDLKINFKRGWSELYDKNVFLLQRNSCADVAWSRDEG
jgi:hypothetical protein